MMSPQIPHRGAEQGVPQDFQAFLDALMLRQGVPGFMWGLH